MSRVLITVRSKDLSGSRGDSKIFLGEWCLEYGDKRYLSGQKFETVRYFWDDRKLYEKDYYHTYEIYEKALDEVSAKLNEIHKTNFSNRYWRIVLGTWLGTFIQVLYERWSNLTVAFKENNPELVYIHKYKEGDFIPFDPPEFGSFLIDDPWNEYIYSKILKKIFYERIKIIELSSYGEVDYNKTTSLRKKTGVREVIGKIKRSLLSAYNILSSFFSSNPDFFFFDTLIPRVFEYKMQFFLRQIPIISAASSNSIRKKVDLSLRSETLPIKYDNVDQDFLKILSEMIFLNMPTCYLENYHDINKVSEGMKWPKKPKAIFTATINKNEVFKQWAAKKVEKGTKLFIRQHGGAYGISKFMFYMDHEYNISDKWFSWGWSDPLRKKIVSAHNIKWGGRSKKRISDGYEIFMHLQVRARYTQHMYCTPVAGQYNKYFSDQLNFIDNLSDGAYKKLVVQPMWIDHGRKQIERLTSRFPDLNISTKYIVAPKKASSIALYVGTYNGTGILEYIYFDVPTIIYWDLNLYEVSNDSFPYFQDLINVGIFHKTPKSAAIHLSRIHDDIRGWWESPDVQKAKNKFCKNYSRKTSAFSYAKMLRENLL
jgi:putative transferase (TIGR04331 family)